MMFSDVSFQDNFFYSYIEEQVTQKKAAPGTIFIFVTQNVHRGTSWVPYETYYYEASNGQLYFYIWTTWFNEKLFGPDYFADVSPTVFPNVFPLTQAVADFAFSFLATEISYWTCPQYPGGPNNGGNNYYRWLSPAWPLICENGPAPPYTITSRGKQYSIANVVLWQWFTGNSKISGQNGAYSFPDATLLTTPADVSL